VANITQQLQENDRSGWRENAAAQCQTFRRVVYAEPSFHML